MLRLLGILITVLTAIAAAMVTWPQFFRLERTFPFAQIVSLRAQLTYCLRTPRSSSRRAIASARTGLMNISSSTK